MFRLLLFFISTMNMAACQTSTSRESVSSPPMLQPSIVTEKVRYDSDDPAIWIHPSEPDKSIIFGTDKGGDSGDGALYAFELDGKILPDQTIKGINRPNNVDIAHKVKLSGKNQDIAVLTERYTNQLRIFRLPNMQPVDGGGIPVFNGESERAPMGIALYQNSQDSSLYVFVSRKSGPSESYIWQYALVADASGQVLGEHIRSFGKFEGGKEIESIAVDNKLGYVYYSDEGKGVRKYYAHPDSSNQELALFAIEGFTEDHEGISIYSTSDTTGYIFVSDQQANEFHVFSREGTASNPHQHPLLTVLKLSTQESDGHEVTNTAFLPDFPHGILVAMSDDKTFQIYNMQFLLEQIEQAKTQ
ncbi:MAG: phytase [Bacteroidota bacterium]